MHKVQEVFSKIGNKLQPAVALSEKLQIPAIKIAETDAPESGCPCDPESIRSWLLANDAFNSREPADALLRTLKRCNRTELAPPHRQKCLQYFEKPCIQALQWLDARYLYRDFPLQADEQIAFKLATALCQEMAYGYKRILYDVVALQENRKRQNSHQDISQGFKHLGRIALRHSMLYRQWPATFWQDASVLVQLAQTCSADNDATLTGIIDQYAHLCAFFILASNKLHASELQGLFSTLAAQALAIQFERKSTGSGLEHYCVGGGSPPSPTCYTLQNKSIDNLFYFSIEPLLQQLETLNSENYGAADNTFPYASVPYRFKRGAARAIRNNLVKAASGVQEIHQHITSMPQTESADSQFTNLRDLVNGRGIQNKPQRSLFNQLNVNNSGIEFVIENQSRTGFGVKLVKTVTSKVQVGGLIAHCYSNTKDDINWHLGTIRWIKTEPDETLKFGVETISKHASAVQVFRFPLNANRKGTTCAGLLANYQPSDCEVTQLLLPAHTCKPGEIVSFKDRRRNRMVKLIETVSSNSFYQSFAIKTVNAGAKVSGPVMTNPSNRIDKTARNSPTATAH